MTAEPDLTADRLVNQLKEVAERLGKKSVSRSEFIRETGVSEWRIYKHLEPSEKREPVSSVSTEPLDLSAGRPWDRRAQRTVSTPGHLCVEQL